MSAEVSCAGQLVTTAGRNETRSSEMRRGEKTAFMVIYARPPAAKLDTSEEIGGLTPIDEAQENDSMAAVWAFSCLRIAREFDLRVRNRWLFGGLWDLSGAAGDSDALKHEG